MFRGQNTALAGPGSGAWRGLPAPCAGSEVSACRQGMGLAGCLPRPESLRRPSFRCHPSPSRRPQPHQQRHHGGGSPGRADEDHQRPHLSSCLRHSPASTRHRHPHHSATARAPRSYHDDDLHPHPAAGWPGRSESLGRPRCLTFLLGLPNGVRDERHPDSQPSAGGGVMARPRGAAPRSPSGAKIAAPLRG
jgi:hypothetical protein